MKSFALPQPTQPAPSIDRLASSLRIRTGEHSAHHMTTDQEPEPPSLQQAAPRPAKPLLGHPLPNVSSDPAISMNTKVCVKCKQEKPVIEFHKNSRSTDGLHSYCKECNRAQALAHIKAEKARRALLRAAKKAAADTE